VTVFPPVDHDRFAGARERRAAAREELGVSDDALVVGAIGNRNPQKGHDSLVRAATALHHEVPELAVRILGAPSPGHETYERSLHEAAAAGGLAGGRAFDVIDPGARVADLIGGLDILCMPSVPNSEGIPTVILEAMTAGVPVVATRVGAVAEAISDPSVGILVEPADDRALVDGLRRLAGDMPLRLAIADRAREHVRTQFSLERLVDAYCVAYERAVDHRRDRKRHGALSRNG
jgi:glycosyltransferase involved in cell wall biosynthesis